jgi:very-short-patch-repair endonuclease
MDHETPRRRVWMNEKSVHNLETISSLRLRSLGFDVEPQVYINGVGFVDLLVEGRVIVELDGRQHRDDSAQYTKDRRRDRVAQLGDDLIFRLDSTDVFARWRGAERDVRTSRRTDCRAPISVNSSAAFPSPLFVTSLHRRHQSGAEATERRRRDGNR